MIVLGTPTAASQSPVDNNQPIKPKKILLIPVDDRPAVSQYAKMIGDIAGAEVVTPPAPFLGKFKQPGQPDSILKWMRDTGIAQYDAVIVSTDMIAYGGLIASRTDRSSQVMASERLRELWRIRKLSHETPFYAFSTLMRIAPTAVAENRAWRDDLYYWAIWSERAKIYNDPEAKRKAAVYEKRVPAVELLRYLATRSRNISIQQDIVKMAYHGAFNHVVFGQDDTAPAGPHIREISLLQTEIERLKVKPRVQFCMGIDQISNCLVTRVLSDQADWSPKVAIAQADRQGLEKIAPYESGPVKESLRDQIETSGAIIVENPAQADYILYLNTPEPDASQFAGFVKRLTDDVDSGKPVAVADINLGWSGTADPKLFDAITQRKHAPQLLSYAGWNTAGNTMGTTIPAANAYLLALKSGGDAYRREVTARTFVLHRLVSDYFYNRYVRPEAYKLIESMQSGNREEIYSDANAERVASLVRQDMTERLHKMFRDQLVAHPFVVDGREYHVVALENIQIDLPWPRAYEVFIDFNLVVREAGS